MSVCMLLHNIELSESIKTKLELNSALLIGTRAQLDKFEDDR